MKPSDSSLAARGLRFPRVAARCLLAAGLALALGAGVGPSWVVRAQEPPQPPAAVVPPPAPAGVQPPAPPAVEPPPAAEQVPQPPAPPAPPDDGSSMYVSEWRRPVVRVGQDFALAAGEHVREVVVVFGSATIEGTVDRDVVVVLGSLRLGPAAVVNGDVVAVGSATTIAPGARAGRDFVSVGGGLDAPAGFVPGREYTVVGLPFFGQHMDAAVPWFTRGLLLGRLIVPSLGWLWIVVGVIVAVYLVLNVLFDRPVRTCRDVIATRPLSAFLMGVLVLVLIPMLVTFLAVSVIGIPVIPFIVCGLFAAALFGKIGLTRWIGHSIVPEVEEGDRLESLRSFAIGTAVILLAYMVPLLGVVVWALGSVFGLGAATLAFTSGLRRESRPTEPPVTGAIVPPVVPPQTPVAPAMGGGAMPLAASEGVFETPAPAAPMPPAPGVSAGPGPAHAAALTTQLVTMPKALFLDRLAAFALDVLLVSLTFNLLDMNGSRAFFTLLLGYHIVFWALKATTVGGIICNLRIVRTDGLPLTIADAMIRGFSSIFSIAALGIGCFWILFDAESQAWHDRFAGTWVVKVPRGWAL